MLCKKSLILCLLLVSLLVSVFCPCLISCSSHRGSVTHITMPREYHGDDTLRDADAPEYYVGNRSTMVFHRPDCNRVPLMSVSNHIALWDPRDDIVAKGYTPCGTCCP